MGSSATSWVRFASALDGPEFAQVQRRLTAYNADRLRPALPEEAAPAELAREYAVAQAELAFIEAQRVAIGPLVAAVPSDEQAFLAWFEQLKISGPGQGDPLFPWLAELPSGTETY